MRKIIIVTMFIALFSLASCGNTNNKGNENAEKWMENNKVIDDKNMDENTESTEQKTKEMEWKNMNK